MRSIALAALALLLLAAGPAQAVYVATPLRLSPTDSEGDVGDELSFDVAPDPEANRSYAGQTLVLRYAWDPYEGQAAPEQPVSDEDARAYRHVDGQSVTLDAQGRASFRWTVPPEVDDRNVVLSLVDAANESVAFAYVRVGDAEPQMRALAGSEGGGVETDGPRVVGEEPAGSGRDVPGLGLLAVAAAVGLALLAARRER